MGHPRSSENKGFVDAARRASLPSMKAVGPVKGCSCMARASSVISMPTILHPAADATPRLTMRPGAMENMGLRSIPCARYTICRRARARTGHDEAAHNAAV